METSQAEIEVLSWIVLLSLVAVIAAIVGLIRSGRAVPLPMIRLRRRWRADDPRDAVASSRAGPRS